MLSTDNNHPCPNCEISQLKSGDGRDSDNNQEVDLINSSLGDNNINNTLPNFSIRNYVFSTRVKDIKNNWPFSHKNLQLCLKYGVKALPPFGPSLYPDGNLSSSHGKLSEASDQTVGQKLTVDKKKFTVRTSKKVETNIQKKCSLIISEATTMSSKVCPVCKTFSSSSNTTLNAHIDQCLSVEPTAKWTAVNSNEVTIKPRIKPRKMRSMVDIYETALHGTLEDLNRRNGTNWASNLGFQARDSEACAVETNGLHSSSVNVQDVNEDSDVYIDSNGTKVRILSKLSDLPSSSNASYDCGPSKFGKRDKRNDFFLLRKKKKYTVQKQKLLDHRVYSLMPDHCPEPKVNNGQQKKPKAFEDFIQPHVAASDQMKSSELGIIKQWVVSKRSGLKEKINPEHERNLRTKSNASSPGDSFVKKRISTSSNPQISSDKTPLLLTDHQSHKRKKKFLCSPSASGKEHSYMDPPDGVENHVSPRNDGISTIPAVKNYTFSSQGNRFSSLVKKNGSNKFSSLRKKLLSVRHTFVPDQKKKMRRKHLDFMKRRLGENEARIGKVVSSESSIRVLKVQKTREIEENVLKGSETTSLKSDSHGGSGKNIDSFTGADFPIDDTYNNVETRDEFICYPSYKMSDEKSFVSLNDSLDSAFCGPTAPNIECFSPHFVGHDSHHDSAEYYVDIDPIPIPGPPGSFLPSPGRMGSEELQGISSLTTCRVQSSENEREIVDMDSLDSPISAISVVSNSFAPAGSESPSVLNWSRVQQTLPETPTPSASNPVLRLMGKNLMVANKEEINPSPNQTRLLNAITTTSTQSSMATIDNPGLWRCVDNGLSTRINIHNEPHLFRSSILPGGPSIFDNTQVGMPAHHFDINSSGRYYGLPSDLRPLQFPSTSFGGNFSSSREYAASGCNLMSNQQLRSYDSPESHEAGLGMNPYYSNYHTQGYNPLNAGSPVYQNSMAQVPFSKGLMNGNLGRWIDLNAQGSSVAHPILPYTGQLRSSMYFSPARFS